MRYDECNEYIFGIIDAFSLFQGWEERVEIALSEVVHVPDDYNTRELKIPTETKRLKTCISALIDMLFKGDFFTVKSIHDTKSMSSESPPLGPQMKKNYINPATEVIPEEEEDESTVVKQNEISNE